MRGAHITRSTVLVLPALRYYGDQVFSVTCSCWHWPQPLPRRSPVLTPLRRGQGRRARVSSPIVNRDGRPGTPDFFTPAPRNCCSLSSCEPSRLSKNGTFFRRFLTTPGRENPRRTIGTPIDLDGHLPHGGDQFLPNHGTSLHFCVLVVPKSCSPASA